MKKHVHTLIKFVFVIVIFLGFKAASAQDDLDLLWEITYGQTYPEIGTSVCQTYDREFAVLGYTNPNNPRGFEIELVLLDTNGNVKWNKVYGGNTNDWGWSIQQTLDGGFIIGGTTTSYGQGPSDGYMIKTSPTGEIQWQKTHGGSGEEEFYSVQQTADSGFILAGSTTSYGQGGKDVYLVKTDEFGNMLWKKAYGSSNTDFALSVQQTTDEGFIVCGTSYTYSSYGKQADIFLLKTDSNGTLQWQKRLGSTGWDDEGYSARQTSDGGYIVTGCLRANAAGNSKVWTVALIKTNANGNVLWNKEFGGIGKDIGKSVQQTPDGGYVIVGETTSFNIGDKDLYLIKTDPNGILESEMAFGGDNDDYGRSVQVTPEGGYIIAGTTLSYGAGESDYYIIRIGDTMPTANAGDDRTEYANIYGIAQVQLDGSDSNDPNNDDLQYTWYWMIDDELHEAKGVNPIIELPLGEYTIELIVNDGRQNSLPDDVNITIVEPTESFLLTYPRPIKRNAGARKIRALLCAPQGVEKDQVDLDEPVIIYPGGIEAVRQRVGKRRIEGVRQTVVIARFDKSELMEFVPENGTTELIVLSRLKNGEYFFGTDLVLVIEKLSAREYDYGDDEDNKNDDDIDDGDDDSDDDDIDDGNKDDGDKDDDDKDDSDKEDGDKDDGDKDDGDKDNGDDVGGDKDDDKEDTNQDDNDQDDNDDSEWPSGIILY